MIQNKSALSGEEWISCSAFDSITRSEFRRNWNSWPSRGENIEFTMITVISHLLRHERLLAREERIWVRRCLFDGMLMDRSCRVLRELQGPSIGIWQWKCIFRSSIRRTATYFERSANILTSDIHHVFKFCSPLAWSLNRFCNFASKYWRRTRRTEIYSAN